MEDATIVPHDKVLGFPLMDICELWSGDPRGQFIDQRTALFVFPPLDVLTVAANVEDLALGDGMSSDQGLAYRFKALLILFRKYIAHNQISGKTRSNACKPIPPGLPSLNL